MTLPRRWGAFVAQLALPVLVGLLAAPRVDVGGTLLPWAPVMADLAVYIHTGEVVLAGGDIIDARAPETGLAFVYPPFAALLCVPLALLPLDAVQLGWVVLCVLALYAVLHRFGLSGWVLSLVTAGVVWFVEPVHATIGFGQLGTVLVALVVLDLVPGPRLTPRLLPGLFRRGSPGEGEDRDSPGRRLPDEPRLLPEGSLTGLAAALKLTPGLFLVILLLAGRRRPALALAAVAVGATAVGTLAFPSESVRFVTELVGGDTRTTEGLYYLTNQSLMGAVARIAGEGAASVGLALGVLAAALGAWAAVRAYRAGAVALAISLGGVATLLASPISWTHHFVWVVPLAAALVDPRMRTSLRVAGWAFAGWVSAAAFLALLPYGGDAELAYAPWQLALSVATPLLGLAVLALALPPVWPGGADESGRDLFRDLFRDPRQGRELLQPRARLQQITGAGGGG